MAEQTKGAKKRGRPKGEDTQVLHVRIPVRLMEQLETLQFVTKKTTSDVVRRSLENYVDLHGDLITAVARARGELQRTYTQAEIDAQERAQIEQEEEEAKAPRDEPHED
ncbi:hypothetical protein AWB79_07532 [Caballeronia hypogeia]|uniref:Uncharacterized protein n=1 Tax=Caballeronia hypogeia TaxID=1777140 RepID=A0A158DTN5_9BURK|nr:hypothetical protein [Caballeronia hypogeia]SAK97883.1 hypothetical protein AWB79_07532 [Caballeronia hypogeia]